MNSVSWILYLADVAGNLGVILAIIGGLAAVATVVCIMIGAIVYDGYLCSPKEKEAELTKRKRLWGKGYAFAITAVVCMLVSSIVPSRNTIMLIAASEFTGQLAQMDSVKDAAGEAGLLATDSLKLLHKYIEDQLTTPAKGDGK